MSVGGTREHESKVVVIECVDHSPNRICLNGAGTLAPWPIILLSPRAAHFGSEFALGVEPGVLGDPYPRHPRGQARAGRYVDRGRDGGGVISRTFCLHGPRRHGCRPCRPRAVGERIYVARWYPQEVFIGGWGFASAFFRGG